ncbi:protein kinase [Plantactinospora sp. BC1]|uniref:serine/threonine-protein kinase n=1 Tax=Plantactinospora sp. BC1 TaxID=2108470 RepID=UPI000D176164|nr:serine/threonine-protein kinase [Plantactinospora sp. BC1]AVT30200.1 protein kinase [Plantactinospora sp. BC1]
MTQIPTWSGGPANPTNGRAAPGITIGGRYSLRAAVGHGGMGTVWRAADTLLRRDVAVKEVVLPPGLAPSDRDAMYERTLREARAAAALQHPAVVQVYDVVTEGGRPWIVMELLDARSLADMVIEDGPLAPRAVAKIGIALLGALEVAHAIGVLHRDVKPANVLICSDGRCVLTDFGVARMPTDVQLTTPGMVLGSPHFISPERAMGQDFGPPSDLFSLGVTLYTAVEGRPPFDKGDPIETMHAVVEDPPAPPVRSGALTRVLLGLLEKDPARRLDVTASRTMLRELLAGPLASNAAGHMVTDPYAVVPSQRSPWQQPAGAPQSPAPAGSRPDRSGRPAANGEIGGSAMLAPGESLTERIARSSRDSASSNRPPAAGANPLDTPTGAMPGSAGRRSGPLHTPTGAMPGTGGRGGTVHTARGGGVGRGLAGARQAGDSVVRTVQGWPRKMQLAVAGGVAAVLLVSIVALSIGGDDPADTPPPQAGPTSQAPVPASFATQPHDERGVSLNVPKDWKKAAPKKAVYIDYTDPDGSGRRVRVLVEDFKGDSSRRWAEIAANGLKSSKSCAKPYRQVGLTDEELSGKPAAQLEYTCGDGDEQRHGIWRGLVQGGKVYSFYLTTPDARFEESKPIFDEMVKSFRLGSAG